MVSSASLAWNCYIWKCPYLGTSLIQGQLCDYLGLVVLLLILLIEPEKTWLELEMLWFVNSDSWSTKIAKAKIIFVIDLVVRNAFIGSIVLLRLQWWIETLFSLLLFSFLLKLSLIPSIHFLIYVLVIHHFLQLYQYPKIICTDFGFSIVLNILRFPHRHDYYVFKLQFLHLCKLSLHLKYRTCGFWPFEGHRRSASKVVLSARLRPSSICYQCNVSTMLSA